LELVDDARASLGQRQVHAQHGFDDVTRFCQSLFRGGDFGEGPERDAPCDDVLQLTNVAGPLVVLIPFEEPTRKGSASTGHRLPERSREKRDVFLSFTEWWQLHTADRKTEEELLAEAATLDGLVDVAPRGREQPHVRGDRACTFPTNLF